MRKRNTKHNSSVFKFIYSQIIRSCLGENEVVDSETCKIRPISTSQTTVRTAASLEALQLQGRRDQKTTMVGESETRASKTFDTLIQSKTKSKVFKQFKSIGSG